MTSSLIAEKLEQAHQILGELGLDAWMVFVRESSHGGDPALSYIYDGAFTWQSALIVTRAGDRIAIVGKFDDGAVRATGVWTEVISYVQSIHGPLVETLRRIDPQTLALDFSVDDYAADGLTHGMYLLLLKYLEGTPYAERLVSAVGVVGALRGRKSPNELARIEKAIETAQTIFDEVGRFAAPGKTEREVARFMQDAAARRGVGLAWSQPCPIVNTGPHSMIGHGVPSDLQIEPGHILHIDFGVQQEGYCSDLQRCWYVPRPGEHAPPESAARAFEAVVQGISVAADRLKPGVEGWQVDQAARKIITAAGYPEYGHALGHHVGCTAHDGGGILGPRWERYGNTPFRKAEPGNVFTLEPSIEDAGGCGCLGIEEMVVVTDAGCRWLSDRQMTLPCLGTSKSLDNRLQN
ncbi:MAG: aminopeptidase P family protein [Planctomycetia bacterium]|nr:aminopeptidase P family protein [Planctomycetia bacterium]